MPNSLTSQLARFFNGLMAMPSLMKGAACVIAASATQVATIADTNETDLANFNVPANVLNQNGVRLVLRCWGTCGATANSKTIRIRFGGNNYVVLNGVVNGSTWWAEFEVQRRASNSQITIGRGGFAGSNGTASHIAQTETDSAAINVRITGQNAVAAAGDVVLEGYSMTWFPAGA